MELKIITTSGVPTMSSLEMVEFINATRDTGKAVLRHDHFCAKVREVIEGYPKFSGHYIHPQNGQKYQCFYFPEREAILMAMSYSPKLQAKVYDAWKALHDKEKMSVATLPNFSNPAEAARAWAIEYEEKEKAQAALQISNEKLKEAQPKVEFHDTVTAQDICRTVREAAKILNQGPNKLFDWLRENGYLDGRNLPYQRHIDAKLFEVKLSNYILPNGLRAAGTTYITNKGLAHLQKKLAEGKIS